MWRYLLIPVVVSALVFGACVDPAEFAQIEGPDSTNRNRAPILAPVGTVRAEEGDRVRIVLSAQDPDLDAVTFVAEPLPIGAVFDQDYGVFEWFPPVGSAATSPYRLTFGVTDGEMMTTTPAIIEIEPATFAIARASPDRVPAEGGTRVTVGGVGFSAPATVRVGSELGLDVVVHDDRSLVFTTPPLLTHFGPQQLSITLLDGRTAFAANAIFVYRDTAEAFASARHYPLELSADWWDYVDVDGDGTDEVIAVGSEGCVLVNPGREGRNTTRTRLCEVSSVQVEAGDFDGNERGDAVVLTASAEVFVARDGQPLDEQPLHRGDAPVRVITAFDLEPDGDDEVLVIDQHGVGRVYMAIGNGRFAEPVVSASLGVPVKVTIVDLDGDRVGDALLEFFGGFGIAQGVETGAFLPFQLIEVGEGYFSPVLEVGFETPTIAAVNAEHVGYFQALSGVWRRVSTRPFDALLDQDAGLLDVDGDGSAELLSTGAGFPGVRIDRVRNERFQQDGWWMTGPVQGPPALADLDGNGIDELVLLSESGEAVVALPISEDNEIGGPTGFNTGGGTSLATNDYTFDGYQDLVVLGAELDGIPAHLQFRGGRTIDPDPALYPARRSWTTYEIGDFTGDGWADAVGAGGGASLDCFPSRGAGVFESLVTIELSQAPVDLVALHREYASSHLAILFADGTARLYELGPHCEALTDEIISWNADAIFAADLNLDSWRELIVQEGETVALFAYQFGRFGRELDIDLGPFEFVAVAGGDVDGDGILDLLFGNDEGLYLLSDLSDRSPATERMVQLDPRPASGLAVGDLNGDGQIEIVVTGGGVAPRFLNRVDDGYLTEEGPPWHSAAISPVFADLDGDVDTELITLEPEFGPVIWWNHPPPTLTDAEPDTESSSE